MCHMKFYQIWFLVVIYALSGPDFCNNFISSTLAQKCYALVPILLLIVLIFFFFLDKND